MSDWLRQNRTAIALFALLIAAWVIGSMADGVGL